jgi:hypothetical protein
MGLQELQPIAANFGPKQQKAYEREYVLATMGNEYVSTFGPSTNGDEQTGGATVAGLENAIMRAGESPVFSTDNEHKAHFSTHLALGTDTIQRIQQQQSDPITADKVFTVLIPHMREHWNVLAKSIFARSFVEQVKGPWGQIEQYATLNHKNAEKMMQAQIKEQQAQQAKQQQVMTDEQLKDLQVQADIKRKDVAMAAKEQRSDLQNQTKAEIMRDGVRSKAETDRLRIRLDAQNKASEIGHGAALDAQAQTLDQQAATLEATPLPQLRADLSKANGQTPSPYDIE